MSSNDDMLTMYNAMSAELRRVVGRGGAYDIEPAEFVRLDAIERRMAVRATYALTEAISHSLKSDSLEHDRDRLSDAERLLCADQEFKLDERGAISAKSAKTPTVGNMRFAFSISAKVAESSFALDTSGDGYRAFLSGLKVRDRLAHPKRPSDLDVTDEEITAVCDALNWFHHEFARLLEETTVALRAVSKRLEAESAKLSAEIAQQT